ncbi:MAG: zinc-binding dehydrogenase, partial [Dehalococcoidia bacterium]
MLQAQWTEKSIGLKDVDPGPPKAGWVRLRVEACGICGSDLHAYRGAEATTPGTIPGHEIVGTVEDGGSGLADRLYVVEPLIFCGECDFCASGKRQICREGQLLGYGEPGGFAESVDLPRYTLHPVDPSISSLAASIAEPLACGYRAVQLARLDLDSRVLVLGAGSIGLLTA